jgi:hypothetical protein
MTLQSPRGENAKEAMAWICGLFRKGVIDWRQAEVLEVMKKNATDDDYCVVIFADPEGIEPHVGATWEDRELNRYVETSSGWNNYSNIEVQIENLPSDIDHGGPSGQTGRVHRQSCAGR